MTLTTSMIAPHLVRGHGITWGRLEEWSRHAGIKISSGDFRRHIVQMVTTQIVLFTDFGFEGLYVGQMKSVISHPAPSIPAIDLMHDVPAQNLVSGAYLRAVLFRDLPAGTAFAAVIDP